MTFRQAVTSGAITFTAIGGIFFNWVNTQQCLDVQAEGAIKFDNKTLEPSEASILLKINTEGCGLTNQKKEDLAMDDVRTDGDVFVHYTAEEYETARNGWIDKALDGQLTPNEFTQKLDAYTAYEKDKGTITLTNPRNIGREALEKIKNRPVRD